MSTNRIGKIGYARILRCLIIKPATTRDVMRRCKLGRTAAIRIMPALHAMGLTYIHSWVAEYRAPMAPVYAFGSKPDAPLPTVRPNGKPVTGSPPNRGPVALPPELVAFRCMLRALEAPSSIAEIRDATGIDERWLRVVIKGMRDLRMVRVSFWINRASGGAPVPYFEFAINTADAPRPAPVRGRVETNRRYRAGRAAREADLLIHRALAGNCTPYREAVAA